MTRWVLLALLVAAALGVLGGATYWRRSADRTALAKRAALLRDVEGHPERMQSEQVELMAERRRLNAAIDREAEPPVRRDLLARPRWQAIRQEGQAFTEREATLRGLERERDARSSILWLRHRIDELEKELSADPSPPREDG